MTHVLDGLTFHQVPDGLFVKHILFHFIRKNELNGILYRKSFELFPFVTLVNPF